VILIKLGFTVREVRVVERAKGPKKTTELLFCGKVGTMELDLYSYSWKGREVPQTFTAIVGEKDV
jgi:hypothetical protein